MANILQTNLDKILTDKNTNLLPENLKQGITCLGVTGTLEALDTSDATATENQIEKGKTAYVKGQKITGEASYPGPLVADATDISYGLNGDDGNVIVATYTLGDVIPDMTTEKRYMIQKTQLIGANVTDNQIATAINLTADKIKAGETILGITGTYTGETT